MSNFCWNNVTLFISYLYKWVWKIQSCKPDTYQKNKKADFRILKLESFLKCYTVLNKAAKTQITLQNRTSGPKMSKWWTSTSHDNHVNNWILKGLQALRSQRKKRLGVQKIKNIQHKVLQPLGNIALLAFLKISYWSWNMKGPFCSETNRPPTSP